MKKQILTCLLAAGVSTAVFGQSVFLDITGNSGALGATSNGLVYKDGVLLAANTSVNVALWGGTATNNLAQLVSLTGANAAFVAIPGGAIDASGASYKVPGLGDNADGYFNAQWWLGSAANYDAVPNGEYRGASGVFKNPTGGGGTPPSVPPGLSGMPSVNLLPVVVPEPSVMVLGALGLASLLVFRRRN